MKKILYLMHIPWGVIKHRPHFIAEYLSKYYKVNVFCKKVYKNNIWTKNKISNDIDNWELPETGVDLNIFILDIVKKALESNNNNKTKTASYLGISLRVLHTYLKKLGM